MSTQPGHTNADRLLGKISALVSRRQSLRSAGASPVTLERNRRQIARLQWKLSRALIELYLPAQDLRTAA